MSCCGSHGNHGATNDEEERAHSEDHEGHQNSRPPATEAAGPKSSHATCGCGGGGNWMFLLMIGVFLSIFVLDYLLK
ncbi:MAG: hypothetical protein A3K60_02765 [Euryarchaeota archaeon RBG_19FT_COMBO_56_21]|nr:MAG: hypothetical protein A3K60_02765 [Euryarchaeota archaeon RBG_19FT_COMBO_56_21]